VAGLFEAGFDPASVLSPHLAWRRDFHWQAALQVITGGGHALDQVMLYCAADKLFLAADQVLSKISPTSASGRWSPIRTRSGSISLRWRALTTTLPYDVMVLPAMACRSTG